MVTFVLGGARSGKSRYAAELAAHHERPAFIVTAEPIDAEMRERIRRHRAARRSEALTVEAPLDLAAALCQLPAGTGVAVVDCLTVWLGNLLHRRGGHGFSGELEALTEVGAFLAALAAPPCPLIVVSNEVGMGIIAERPPTRAFTDLHGRLNQAVAARAHRVLVLLAGLPLELKPAAT